MQTIVRSVAVFVVAMIISGCMGPPERVQEMANRNYMRYAMGKNYQQVANLNPTGLPGSETAFGPRIGAYQLQGGDTVYRHIGVGGTGSSSVDFASLIGSESEVVNYRLAYFRVGPEGTVKDWATGSVPGQASRCINYIGGIVQRCSDQQLAEQNLALFDSIVETSSGAPISAWGEPLVVDASGEALGARPAVQ